MCVNNGAAAPGKPGGFYAAPYCFYNTNKSPEEIHADYLKAIGEDPDTRMSDYLYWREAVDGGWEDHELYIGDVAEQIRANYKGRRKS